MTPRSWTIEALQLAALSLSLGGCAEGCGGGGDDTYVVDSGVPLDGPCLEASERVGALACVHSVPNRATYEAISAPAMAADQLGATKYLLPASDTPDPLPLLFLNVHTFTLHYDLMVEAFPERFPGFTRTEYVRLLAYDKAYFAGNLAEYYDPRGDGTFFGFTVWDDPADDSTTVTQDQVEQVWIQLSEAFALGELVFVPSSSNQSAAVEGWDAPFPIRGIESSVDYEVYNQTAGFGQLTLMTLAELAEATEAGALSTEQILILDEAPFDVERVISGAVTGTRQGQLSHLNVRSAARGTPNCYVADPFEVLGQWDGQLVRLECGAEALEVRAATRAEAEAWWASIRPEPVAVPAIDRDTRALLGLLELPTATASERTAAVSAYGSKGANLASLYQRIPAELQLEGFLVPFAGYLDFMESGTWTVDLGAGEGTHSFAETVAAWVEDEAFLSDAALRRARLEALRAAMLEAPVDPALLAELEARVVEVFGDASVMVRFRSSSNAEDALGFSGAGLYDSESACVADSQDGDAEGPSRCDP
ncbi:MAG: hypothetical protein H6740_20155, partial [Alphaproteobacteria bacterium]|nr:hypothetical protein [Alphaproteobacteria bacterium]